LGPAILPRLLPASFPRAARHAWNFAPVNATGIRLTVPDSSFADGADIDELEVAAFAPAPFTLQTVGGTMGLGNVALSGEAFAKDVLTGYTQHTNPASERRIYGNENSWIGNSLDSFAGVDFHLADKRSNRIAFGRDNSPFYADRAPATTSCNIRSSPARMKRQPTLAGRTSAALHRPARSEPRAAPRSIRSAPWRVPRHPHHHPWRRHRERHGDR
jgi:hypothetical protein